MAPLVEKSRERMWLAAGNETKAGFEQMAAFADELHSLTIVLVLLVILLIFLILMASAYFIHMKSDTVEKKEPRREGSDGRCLACTPWPVNADQLESVQAIPKTASDRLPIQSSPKSLVQADVEEDEKKQGDESTS